MARKSVSVRPERFANGERFVKPTWSANEIVNVPETSALAVIVPEQVANLADSASFTVHLEPLRF